MEAGENDTSGGQKGTSNLEFEHWHTVSTCFFVSYPVSVDRVDARFLFKDCVHAN